MARDLNQCSFIGRLGKDPEMKYLQSGDAIANFSIAVGESWKDKQTGENKEKTEWVNISCFGKLAEICGQYLKKGSKIYASGSMETRKWQDQSGADRYSTGIKLKDMQMLDSKSDSQQGSQQQSAPQHQQQPQQQMAPQYQQPAPQQQQQPRQTPVPNNPATGAPQQQQSWGNPPPNQPAPQQQGQQQQGQYNEPSMDFDEDSIPF